MNRDDEFSEYVSARAGALLRTAHYLCAGNSAEAEDLLQNALVKGYVHWHRIERRDSADAYIRKIMARLAYRRRPRLATTPLLEGEQGFATAKATTVEAFDDVSVARADLAVVLRRLPPRQRAVIVLRYYEDLSEVQIADTLGCSRGTVKVHASRALKTLKTLIDSSHVQTEQTGRS